MRPSLIEQRLLEATHWPRRIVLAIAIGLALALAYKAARADEPRQPPQASFGVTQCGEVVAIWVVTKDGKLFRTDPEHHPDTPAEYNAFLQWLTTAQSDIYVLPCKDINAGGKPKKKAQS